MDEFESLNHTRWDCKYHVVFIAKYRRKVLYGELKRHFGLVFRQLAERCSATIWMGKRRRSGMHFDGRGRLMIVAAREQCKRYFVAP
jgi:putative transposase